VIAQNESTPSAAEVPFMLPTSSNPLVGLTGHAFTLGEVQVQLPGGSFFNIPVIQIVEKGFGLYAVQLDSTQTLNQGLVYIKTSVTGAQPYEGVEQIGVTGGDIVVGTQGYVPFYLPQSADPINGPPITGHTFSLGEVQIVVPGSNTFVNVALVDIQEIGLGAYQVIVTGAESAMRGKVYIYANVSGAQPYRGFAMVLNSSAGGAGGAAPVMSNVTPNITYTIGQDTPIQFDLTVTAPGGDVLGFAVVWSVVDAESAPELVHDWVNGFSPLYSKNSTRVPITDGYRYKILRDDGWPVPPVIKLFAVDLTGQVLVV
jgi:hypothetical protein